MSKKYGLWFDLTKTEGEARQLVTQYNQRATRYVKSKKPAHYTPYHTDDGSANYIVWSYQTYGITR